MAPRLALMLLAFCGGCEAGWDNGRFAAAIKRRPWQFTRGRLAWGGVTEHPIGRHPTAHGRFFNQLVARAGGSAQLITALGAVPEGIRAEPQILLECLADIFRLDNAEFTVLSAAYFWVSGGPTIELECSLFVVASTATTSKLAFYGLRGDTRTNHSWRLICGFPLALILFLRL